MAFPERNIPSGYGSRAYSAEIDQGLRSYMLSVYNYMAIGLAVTGGVAALAANASVASWDPITLTSFGAALYTSPLQWLVMLAPIGLVLVFSFGIQKLSMPVAQGLFWAFAARSSWSTPSSRSRRCSSSPRPPSPLSAFMVTRPSAISAPWARS